MRSPGFFFLPLDFYFLPLYIFTLAAIVAVIVMAILGIFKRSPYNRLSTRIAALILASVPITLILIPVSNEIMRRALLNAFTTKGSFAALAIYVLIALGTPLVLGLLAARFVRRPLRQFNEAITSLEQSNYKVQLQSMGIREFDEVFLRFNNLTNRLRHEEKLRKDLVSDTSHELNTPLTTMIGQLTAMQEGKYPLTEERVAILKEQAERLAELVQQLGAYTKARMPDPGEPEDIHLRPFCEELITHFSLDLKQKGITTGCKSQRTLSSMQTVAHFNRFLRISCKIPCVIHMPQKSPLKPLPTNLCFQIMGRVYPQKACPTSSSAFIE